MNPYPTGQQQQSMPPQQQQPNWPTANVREIINLNLIYIQQ
jgi:hypothetical protein